MKNYPFPKLFSGVFFTGVFLFLPVLVSAQLSGNYTINPRASASSTNYKDWASAVGDLKSGSRSDGGSAQGPGVSSAVTFTVYDTLYNNVSLEFTAINGTSPANTIRFLSKGGDSTKCVLRFASTTTSADDWVIFMNGADYVTFQEIGFERTGTNTYSTVIQIANASTKTRFVRCRMLARKLPSSSSLGFNYGIGSCIYFTGGSDSVEIIDNKLIYGYNGVYCASAGTGNLFQGNIVDTSGSAGMYITSQTSLRVLGNTFNMGDFGTGKGHYTSYGMRIETSPAMIVARNKVFMLAKNGQVCRAIIIASTTSTASAPTLIYNNWVVNSGGTADCTGLAVYACNYLNFMYNNVLITNSLTNGAAYYHYATYTNTYIKLINNNLINKGAGYAINVPGTNTSDLDTVNFNNLFSNGSYLGNWGGVNYSSFSAWKTNSGKDANSTNVDPGYISNSNLHVSNISINGKALPYSIVPDDIDGDTRDKSVPDIGADEFFPIANDAGVTGLDSPILFCAGKQRVKVTFQNFGYDTLTSVKINWQVNGSTQTPYSWTGKLSPGASATGISLGTYTFNANTNYSFRIWSDNPNGNADGRKSNDSLRLSRSPAMSGNYTLDDTTTADFKSFNDAINAMTARGICGPVTFNVYPGTYTEQITLLQLPGMGSSNPVTFQNVNKDSTRVLITLPSTIATGNNNACLQLRGADYVTFKGISFERTGTNTYAHVIHILNGSNNNAFISCRMLGLPLGASNANAMNIWSDQGQDNNNVFRNNYIKDGNISMQYFGLSGYRETGTVIEGNTFSGGYVNALQLTLNDGAIVRKNTFLNIGQNSAGSYDVQLYDCDSAIRVTGNTFKDVFAENAILISGCQASKANPGIIANNFLIRSAYKGISIDASDNQYIVYNSMSFNGTATTNAGIYTSATTSSNLVLRNNNIVMDGGDLVYITNPAHIYLSDNNNYLNRSTQFAYWGTACTSLSNMVTVSSKDQKSMSFDPLFTSSTDLHIKNPLLKGAGAPVSGVTTDFDGETRNSTTPDIGADEFKLTPDDAGIISLVKPVSGTCAGPADVAVVIKNFGGDTLRSATINWSISGVAQTPYNWKGKLATNRTDTIQLGSYNFYTLLSPLFVVKTTLPNGNTDIIRFNDSIQTSRFMRALPNANAGADFSICPGDSVYIGPGSGTGLSYQWTTIDNKVIGNTAQILVKPSKTTKYILEVTNTLYGCAKKDTIEISINSRPTADAGKDKTICRGTSVQIGETAQTGMNYYWMSNPGGFTSTTSNPYVSPLQTTSFIMEKSINATGCNDLDTVVITVINPPVPKINGTLKVCKGVAYNFNVTQNPGNTYQWTTPDGILVSGQTTNSVMARWNKSGTGTIVAYETSSAGCSDSAVYDVTILTNPVSSFVFSKTCLGNETRFTDQSTGAVSYSWDFGDGSSSNVKNLVHIYSVLSNYKVKLAIKDMNGCADTSEQTVPIYPNPAPHISSAIKPGQIVNFKDSSSIDFGTVTGWKWYFGDGDSSVQQNPVHQYKSLGNYTVKLCAMSDQGCEKCTSKAVILLSVRGVKTSAGLKLSPNPGTGLFRLESMLEMQSFKVVNALGETVLEQSTKGRNAAFDLSGNPTGIYFVSIQTSAGIQAIRLILE